MKLTVRPGARRAGRSRALILTAAGSVLVFAVTGPGGPAASGALARQSSVAGAGPGSAYTLMQMNLCLSGVARCYGRVAYPAGVEEAVARIVAARPDAVTVNEACHGDVARIARRIGYNVRFSAVTSSAGPVRCVRPGGRGRFGDAVLTRAAIAGCESHAFAAQGGTERRRWLCVTTDAGVDVCTAHLATRAPAEQAANDAQCAELRAILARRVAARPIVFGGDVNRHRSCAPDGLWTRTDASAGQAPSLQHAYGSDAIGAPAVQVDPATHTDHDVLVVHAGAGG